jgi:hypothetical protein
MTKAGNVAAIGLYLDLDAHTAAVGRYDRRACDENIISIFDSPQIAIKAYANMMRVSLQMGWKILYDGRQLYG